MVIPQAIEVEQNVLGACINDESVFHDVRERLNEGCFYLDVHKDVYSVLVKEDWCDIVILEQRLKDSGAYKKMGDGFLIDLSAMAGYNIERYCQILIEKKIHRDVITGAQEVLKKSQQADDVYKLVDEFARRSESLGLHSVVKHSLTPSEIRERDKDKPKAEKLYLGYSDIDMGIYGDSFRRGQNLLTIADSGHGKTQYAMFLSECLLRRGYKVAWFQLEGYDSETSNFIIDSGVPDYDNMFICDSLYDIEDIKRESRRLNREHGIDFAVFDYVQNIECSQNISKTEKVEYISKEITKLGKELNLVTSPLSQITIDSTRHGWQQEPRYNDVRWSKQLKQDASLITSVFRPSRIDDLVLSEKKVKDWKDRQVPYNSVFVKQAKVRHGKQEWKRLHLIHTDKGLKPYTETTSEQLYKAPL